MDQNENILSRVYKNLFKNNEFVEEEIKISQGLDKKNGVFNIPENNSFNFKGKVNIFNQKDEKNIFAKTSLSEFSPKFSYKDNIPGSDELDFNKGALPPGIGNIFNEKI